MRRTKVGETTLGRMPSKEFLDGPSATLLSEGTRAYQALTHTESSVSRRVCTRDDPGKVLAFPEMQTSLAELLSTYTTQGLFINFFFQSFKQRTTAKSSASKITVDFPGNPNALRSSLFRQKDIAATSVPEESTNTPPRPQGQFSSSGQKEASVNKKSGTSQHGVISLGRELFKDLRKVVKHIMVWGSKVLEVELYACFVTANTT